MGPAAISEAATSPWWLCLCKKQHLNPSCWEIAGCPLIAQKGKPLAFSKQGCFVSTNLIVESFDPREGPSGETLLSYRLATLVFHWPSLPSPWVRSQWSWAWVMNSFAISYHVVSQFLKILCWIKNRWIYSFTSFFPCHFSLDSKISSFY